VPSVHPSERQLAKEEETRKGKRKERHMTIRKMTRSFRYLGLILSDPASDLDVESVRSFYAASYPEITTAALTGPEAVDGTLVYTFAKAIGTKG
jgi:PRTRC genetic system protein C